MGELVEVNGARGHSIARRVAAEVPAPAAAAAGPFPQVCPQPPCEAHKTQASQQAFLKQLLLSSTICMLMKVVWLCHSHSLPVVQT